ncbi:glycosyl hydrolase [Pelobium manganitolerans]|uniref:Glycosyl hydrolase n=1 Tax=Pelobium manganitolerans TaxID=1842495 RepID=A0A419S6K2_9SPHI|nr:glycosyltransferase family 2 protein [Pelobium manganitolerans]RKD16326.1 glycosyl hydrolase [Pelobium manganitolerans]
MKFDKPDVYVVIPAYNEEKSIAKVLNDIPAGLVKEVLVCNNNSTDATAAVAQNAGARVLFAKDAGYGNACLAGLAYLESVAQPQDIIVFLDGDYSDYPQQMPLLLQPILDGEADLVIGSRALGSKQKGAMTAPQLFGNWLATKLIRLFYSVSFTDLGPFRAIGWGKLRQLDMQDKTYGWTVEMQVKAAKQKLICIERAVDYRKRIGKSKISGTVKGVILAGYKIIWTIFKNL